MGTSLQILPNPIASEKETFLALWYPMGIMEIIQFKGMEK